MAVLCDWRIRKFAEQYDMINPFSESVSGNNIISFGLSAAGYDVRLGNEIKVYRPDSNTVINPKKFRVLFLAMGQ
jgi:dCTP deaminase